jgi:tight adherence protein B
MGRASMWVLIGLPFALAGILTLINHSYMSPLWTTHTGHVLIYFTLGSMVMGWYSLRRIVNFKG